jgi:hypothetical protein
MDIVDEPLDIVDEPLDIVDEPLDAFINQANAHIDNKDVGSLLTHLSNNQLDDDDLLDFIGCYINDIFKHAYEIDTKHQLNSSEIYTTYPLTKTILKYANMITLDHFILDVLIFFIIRNNFSLVVHIMEDLKFSLDYLGNISINEDKDPRDHALIRGHYEIFEYLYEIYPYDFNKYEVSYIKQHNPEAIIWLENHDYKIKKWRDRRQIIEQTLIDESIPADLIKEITKYIYKNDI